MTAHPTLVTDEQIEALSPADRALWDAMGDAKPRYSVMPTAGAMHELDACRVTARMLGTPLLPWQEWTARLATERRLDDPRRYTFPFFLITVPRQAGKTTIVRVILLTRMILYVERRAFYTAQTGKDATERWADLCAAVERKSCPLKPLVTIRKAAGSSRLTLEPTGSRLSPFAPTESSLHGYTPHDVAVDELFAFDDTDGDELLGAIVPAQGTLPDRQLIGLSTAGNRLSTFLRRLVKAGRKLVRPDLTSELGELATPVDNGPSGYVEWSLAPGRDPFAPESWTFHPAYGHTQQLEDFEQAVASVPPGVWIRAYCNQWTEDSEPIFDMTAVDRCAVVELADPSTYPSLDRLVVGFGTAPDRSRVAAVAAWPVDVDGERRVAATILHASADLAGWVDYLVELADAGARLYGDDGGLNRSILDELARRFPDGSPRLPVPLTSRDWQIASSRLRAALDERRLALPGVELDDGRLVVEPPLRFGIEGAVSRPMGESWALSHKGTPESTALAAALRGVEVHVDTPKPEIYA